MEDMEKAYKTFTGKPEGKKPLERRSRRWKDNIRTDIRVMVWEDMDCIHLAQDKDQWRAMKRRVL
jgi:hypothetical protein